VLTGAVLTIAKDTGHVGYASPLSYLMTVFAFVFWKIDERNKELIKHGEKALKSLEKHIKIQDDGQDPQVVQLFTHEEWKASRKPRFPKAPFLSAHMSYSDCFNVVFSIFGVGGFILGSILAIVAIA